MGTITEKAIKALFLQAFINVNYKLNYCKSAYCKNVVTT